MERGESILFVAVGNQVKEELRSIVPPPVSLDIKPLCASFPSVNVSNSGSCTPKLDFTDFYSLQTIADHLCIESCPLPNRPSFGT